MERKGKEGGGACHHGNAMEPIRVCVSACFSLCLSVRWFGCVCVYLFNRQVYLMLEGRGLGERRLHSFFCFSSEQMMDLWLRSQSHTHFSFSTMMKWRSWWRWAVDTRGRKGGASLPRFYTFTFGAPNERGVRFPLLTQVRICILKPLPERESLTIIIIISLHLVKRNRER